MLRYLLIIFPLFCLGQNGTLDPSFNGNGMLVLDIDELDECVGVESHPEGGYLFYGQSGSWNGSVFLFDIVIGKLTRTGDLDTTFGINGLFSADFPGFNLCNLKDMEVDSSGVYFFGSGVNAGILDTNEVFVGKLNLNGQLDTTFADSGFYSPQLISSYNTAGGITIDSDDKLTFVGSTTDQSISIEYPYMGRLSKTGIPDSTFGSTGIVAWDYFQDTLIDASSISPSFERHGEGGYLTQVIEINGSFFATGYVLDSFNAKALTLMMRKDGTFNPNYNGTGYLVYEPEVGYNFFSNDLLVHDNKLHIVLETNGFVNEGNLLIQKIDTNGILDPIIVFSLPEKTCEAKDLLQVNNEMYLGGFYKHETATTPGYDSDSMMVMKVDLSGNIQTDFASNGYFIESMGTGDEIGVEGIATQWNQMVLAGYVNNIGGGNYVDFAFMVIHPTAEVGFEESEDSDFTIYPNPSDGIFHIHGNRNGSGSVVYDLVGNYIGKFEGMIDLTAEPSGVYVMRTKTKLGWKQSKIVKY